MGRETDVTRGEKDRVTGTRLQQFSVFSLKASRVMRPESGMIRSPDHALSSVLNHGWLFQDCMIN